MALFEWKAEYNLGIASIDRQHRRLVAMINVFNVNYLVRFATIMMAG